MLDSEERQLIKVDSEHWIRGSGDCVEEKFIHQEINLRICLCYLDNTDYTHQDAFAHTPAGPDPRPGLSITQKLFTWSGLIHMCLMTSLCSLLSHQDSDLLYLG